MGRNTSVRNTSSRKIQDKSNISSKMPIKGKKKIFTEDSDEFHTADEGDELARAEQEKNLEQQQGDDDDEIYSESDSDSDDAPEEETISSGKDAIKVREVEKQKAAEELNRQARLKRREQDKKFKEQQESKKSKIEESIPEFLDEDILESLNRESEVSVELKNIAKGKHLKIEDFEELDKRELKKQIKLQKLKQLKAATKTSIKRGPVNVRVTTRKQGLVPKAERKVVGVRDKWLRRKSLGKK